jgi:hypothetical protein
MKVAHEVSFMKFCLFGKSIGCDLSHFSELLDFSKSCFLTSLNLAYLNHLLGEISMRLSLVILFLENLLGLGLVIFTTLF